MRHAANAGRMPVPRPDRGRRKPGRRRMTPGPAGPASAVAPSRPGAAGSAVAGAVPALDPLPAPVTLDSPVTLQPVTLDSAVTLPVPMPVVSTSGARSPALATTLVRPTETGWPEPVSPPGTAGGPMGLGAETPDLMVPDAAVPEYAVQGLTAPRLTAPHPAAPHSAAPDPVARGRAAGRGADKPPGTSWVTQIPYALALIGVAGGLVAIRQSTPHLRSGTLVLAGALLFAALARMVLPDRRAGMLSSRRRWLDTVIFAAFGVSLLVVALVVLPPS